MSYIGNRILQALISIFGVSTIVFFALRLSGDPVLLMVPPDATLKDIEILRHALGLDQPVGTQYIEFLRSLMVGQFGNSFTQNCPVFDIIMQRFPYTLQLAATALFLSVTIGITVGVLSALYRGKWIERILMPLILVGQSMPAFWTGIVLILVFSVTLHLLPSSGAEGFESVIMPAVTLASLSMATTARMTRASVIEQLSQDYVRTARSKGVNAPRLIIGHVIRNAAIPVITVIGLEGANLLGGSVLTETVFAWPGIGLLMIQAISSRDFPLVQGIVLFFSTIYITINLGIDLLYVLVDPRIKLGKGDSS